MRLETRSDGVAGRRRAKDGPMSALMVFRASDENEGLTFRDEGRQRCRQKTSEGRGNAVALMVLRASEC